MRMVASPLMSTGKKDDWETPSALFTALDREFRFTLDVAANAMNAKCQRWLGPGSSIAEDALARTWTGERCWLNPPYSRRVQAAFIRKCADETLKGTMIVALLPARTDTRAFHTYIWDERRHLPRPWVAELRLLRGRVRFVGAAAGAPFPSMVVVWEIGTQCTKAR